MSNSDSRPRCGSRRSLTTQHGHDVLVNGGDFGDESLRGALVLVAKPLQGLLQVAFLLDCDGPKRLDQAALGHFAHALVHRHGNRE